MSILARQNIKTVGLGKLLLLQKKKKQETIFTAAGLRAQTAVICVDNSYFLRRYFFGSLLFAIFLITFLPCFFRNALSLGAKDVRIIRIRYHLKVLTINFEKLLNSPEERDA